MVHTLPCVALLVGTWMDRLGGRHPRAAFGLLAALTLLYLHNLPMLVTRYIVW